VRETAGDGVWRGAGDRESDRWRAGRAGRSAEEPHARNSREPVPHLLEQLLAARVRRVEGPLQPLAPRA
jgi:hypothetical protein